MLLVTLVHNPSKRSHKALKPRSAKALRRLELGLSPLVHPTVRLGWRETHSKHPLDVRSLYCEWAPQGKADRRKTGTL